ncbi:Sec-independent periplasmic protein translocase [Natrinema pellirubrum DSM 15624]|uniref:Sec-independent protein translocase protein TatC n=1 Tax=Natrinema pellirubrum (strain DSM 15624 / CIP 106293 / JCM 10476 / NCIMB 786 / 157) TaxID=797303 RepID=L0JEW5_NATP1|nr:twin-arginine translocase subunit TatC [Natrinema pellirubrum]AGB30085.1 Sec-independent protein secretion pathway component TatC [Natrinema pellirubrum DSM 15624]ELY70100.1 Sec-independent periplasmic protein translocase [Natrinema pellirubrum DSM 15624]
MSSAVDEDTAQAINTGRETIGALLSGAQQHLKKVFVVFLLGFLGSFYALRIIVWDFLEATAKSQMSGDVAASTDIITRTPFEVILLQAKIGMLTGAVVAVPALLFFSRKALRRRGYTSSVPISRRFIAGFILASLSLFVAGVVYAYSIFFPFAFDFLAGNAVSAGVKPSFGITEFTEFMALLTLSFGLAAQLPLLMGVLSYTEIIPYETFRDKWRHAVVAVTVFGGLFSPPDPFTLVMWAMPMVGLYVFSLGLAKLVTNLRRRGAAKATGSGTDHIKRRTLQFVGALAAVAIALSAAINQGGFDELEESVFPLFPSPIRPAPGGPGGLGTYAAENGLFGDVAVGAAIALVVGVLVLFAYTVKVLQSPVYPRQDDIRRADDPSDVDFETLDVDDIADVPTQVFQRMSEDDALDYSRQAMYDDDREKAEAILDRFDTVQETTESDGSAEAAAGASGGAAAAAGEGGAAEDDGGLFASTAAGMLDPFTEDETTEDDIGGYAYDIAFILNSLTSKVFRIVGLFMVVMGGTFFWLYSGGLGDVLTLFLDRVPRDVLEEVVADGVDPSTMSLEELIAEMDIVVALHPVEVLIFEVKVSALAGIVAVLPLILYYAWPPAKERGLVRGDRRTFLVWGGGLLGGFALGTYLGFFWVAPSIISYLVSDALANQMIVSYRIKSFFWLVIFTTVGIGFLLNIIVTMALFHVGGVVSYRSMLERWRPVVVGIFVLAAFFSPKGVLMMLLFSIPIALTYLLGLGILYVLTGGGRLFGGGGGGSTAEPDGTGATPE